MPPPGSKEPPADGLPRGAAGGNVAPILFVYNERSRRGPAALRELRDAAERRGLAGGSSFTSIGDLERRPAGDSPERVVAVGGDGTVNAAVHWMRERGIHAPLGIVPGGTGNNLARGLGIPRSRSDAIAAALGGAATRRIDLLRYRPLRFPGSAERSEPGASEPGLAHSMVQGGALGFPADVAARYETFRRRSAFRLAAYPFGGLVYRLLALLGLAGGSLPVLRLEASLPGGERIDADALAVFVGNEPTLGGGFRPCPRAILDDGNLDLCIVRAGTGRSRFLLFREVARGTHLRLEREVLYRQTRGPVELRLSRRTPLLADGDIRLNESGYRLEVEPGAVEVLVG